MNFDWKLILPVVLVTLILSVIFGIFMPRGLLYITALIGGSMAGYLIDGNYTDGITHGGISVGISGVIYYIVISPALNSMVMNTTMANLTPAMVLSSIVFYFIFGVLGGLLGFAVRERRLIIQIMR